MLYVSFEIALSNLEKLETFSKMAKRENFFHCIDDVNSNTFKISKFVISMLEI